MFDKLKKLLEGGVAQANIFDGGKTFQSVVNNRTPQQQNAVQQQQLQARQFNAARPQQAPQQNFTDKLRDILDANSQADKFRRAQEGQALDYRNQQEQARQQAAQQARVVRPQVQASGLDNVNKFSSSFNERYIGGLGRGIIRGAEWLTPGDQTGTANNMVNTFFPEAGSQAAQGGLARLADKNSIGGKLGTGAKAATEVVMTALPSGAATKATQGLGVVNNLSKGGRVARLASKAIPEMVGGVPASAVSVFNARGRGDEQNLTKEVGIGLAIDAATPTVFKGIGKLARPVIDAAGNAVNRVIPRSVAEIAQEVATARQPAIANNAPRTRVAPDGTSLPPRSASQIAQELADSKARAVDPAVQARRAVMNTPNDGLAHVTTPGSALGILDDGKIRANPIGEQGGAKGVSMGTNYKGRNGETLNWADQFAEPGQPKVKINIDRTKLNAKQLLQNDMELTHTGDVPLSAIKSIETDNPKVAAEYRAKGVPVIDTSRPSRSVPQTAPKPGNKDPLEALKAEARKYKSADEFSRSYDAEELLYKKVASDISAQTPKELRVKPTSLGVLKGNLRGSWVDNGDAYTFYPKKSFSPDWEKELARVVPDAKVSSGAVDFPKSKYKSMNYEDLGTVYNQATKPKAYYQNVPRSYTKTAFEQNTGVVAPTKKAKLELNTKRLNLTPEQTAQLDPKVKSVVDRMSNDDVVRIAKSAGLDTKSYSPGETRVKIAEQLNVRQDAVRLMNEAEVARKAGNTDQAAELLKQAAEQGRISRTQGTDLARQLQARRIIANELDTPQQKVFKLFDEAGVNPDVYTKRLAGVDFSDSKQVVNAYRELVPAKAGQWLDTVRYNSMLSSPLTQVVNIFGNAQNVAGVAPIEKTIRGGIDSIAGLFGKERQYAAGEGASYLKGEVKALPKAAKSFVDALKGSGEYANQDFSDYNMPLATKGAAGKAYQALSFPMRVLDGMDKFFRTLASSGEEAALDKRVSKGIGLRGDKQSLIDQEAAYRVYQAEGHIPGQGKVLDAMDSVADLVMSGRNSKNPILSTISKFTVPFVKTVNNINKQGFIEYSPAGLLNLVGKEDKIEGITKAVMGTAVFGTSALLLKSGDMTWAEPRNAEERARFRSEGKQPYAIKMGGKWYNYSKLTPVVAFPMAMTAALDDAFNKGKADQSFIDKTLTAFAKYGNFMSDQSYAKSIGDTLGAIGGDEEAIARMVSNQWQQVVPARAFTGWLARMTDDVERKVDTTQGYFDQQVQAFMQQYPGLRQKTPTRDYQGQPIAANNPVLNAFSPVRVTNDRGVSPLDAEQDAIKLATDKAELLDKRQLKEVDNRSADKIREAQKQLISQPGWNELTAEEKKSGLSRLESDIKAVEKLQYQADNHVGEYSGSYTGKSTKLTANQKTLVNDGVKLSKYVGKSDSTEAKTNKEKYEKAFEDFNDPDNGYSRVEKVKKREELKRLTVQKDYDEDTTMLHGMSKEDVWGFLSTYEDGKAMADKLLALDDALTAAGVQDKNKFRDKYGNITIKPKEKSSGGSKAKTVKGQAEAVSSERKLRALLANTNNKASYRKPATQSAKVGLKKFAVKSAGLTSKKGA